MHMKTPLIPLQTPRSNPSACEPLLGTVLIYVKNFLISCSVLIYRNLIGELLRDFLSVFLLTYGLEHPRNEYCCTGNPANKKINYTSCFEWYFYSTYSIIHGHLLFMQQ